MAARSKVPTPELFVPVNGEYKNWNEIDEKEKEIQKKRYQEKARAAMQRIVDLNPELFQKLPEV